MLLNQEPRFDRFISKPHSSSYGGDSPSHGLFLPAQFLVFGGEHGVSFQSLKKGLLFVFTFALFVLWSVSSIASSLPDFTALVEKHGGAVVNISTVQKKSETLRQLPRGLGGEQIPDIFRHFFENLPSPQRESQSLGSGFIISDDGYVLTNHHVINGASEVIVRLADRRELVAEIIGSDEASDLALIKVEGDGLPTVKLGASEALKVGEWVFAIGSPYGFDRSVTAGIVSAKGRNLPNDNYVPFIQTDVAINPGNSGGPLFNMEGEVIGINSQIYSRTGGFMGLSFAIPVDIAMEVVAQLKNKGHVSRGWLGVVIQEVNRDLAESFGLDKPRGALVAQVLDDSPAEKAGIEAGDIITDFNGFQLNLASDLPPVVGRVAPGESAKIRLIREKREKKLNVKVGELPEKDRTFATGKRKKQSSDGKLGIQVDELSDEQKERWDLSHGVVVMSVSEGPAIVADIRPGDVITMLNYKSIKSIKDYNKVVKGLPSNKSVPMQIHRRGKPLFVPIRVED